MTSGPRPLAAVVLLVVVEPELPAVVGATHKLAPAPGVAVMQTPVTWTVAVSLPLVQTCRQCLMFKDGVNSTLRRYPKGPFLDS